jgi:hypothetical protein
VSTDDDLSADDQCGKWMKRAKTTCARKPNHLGDCRTERALADKRERLTERRRGKKLRTDPAARARWNRTYRLSRYGLTEEQFGRLLETQGYACAMCFDAFEDGKPICIDHDHNCCADEKRSCGGCVRGLLCLGCNTGLGYIERLYDLACPYLDAPPAVAPMTLAEAV